MKNVTQAEFARQIGMSKAYVTKMKDQGRLVFDDKGKVIIDESVQLIKDTSSPDKNGVAERHKKDREEKELQDEIEELLDDDEISQGHRNKIKNLSLQLLEARVLEKKEQADAIVDKNKAARSQLLLIDEVRLAIIEGDTIVRNRLESLPDKISPLLAMEQDEQKIRAILIDEIEYILSDISKTIKNMMVKPL